MTFDPDDPRLTAFALGELEGDERSAVESQLADHPEARAAVEEVRALARLLTEGLRAEPAPGLSDAQRRTIAAHLDRPAAVPFRPRWGRLALAATLLLGLGLGLYAWYDQFARKDAGPGLIAMNDRGARGADTAAKEPAGRAGYTGFEAARVGGGSVEGRGGGRPTDDSGAKSRSFSQSRAPANAPARPAAQPETAPAARADLDVAPGSVPAAGAANAPVPPPVDPYAFGRRGQSVGGAMAGGVLTPETGASAPAAPGVPKPGDAPQPPALTLGLDPAPAASGPASAPSPEDMTPRMAMSPTAAPAAEYRAGAVGRGDDPKALKDLAAQAKRQADMFRVEGYVRDGSVLYDLDDALQAKKEDGQLLEGAEAQGDSADSKPRPDQAAELEAKVVALKDRMSRSAMGRSEAEKLSEEIREAETQLQGVRAAAAGIQPLGRERFTPIVENAFEDVTPGDTFSTFAIDVDTAGYANVRRYLNQRLWPPADAVRIEEMVNYFDYDYAPPAPDDPTPFAVHTEVVRCPWEPGHELLRVGLKGRAIDFAGRKPSNLVFLVDVSGSMDEPDKLPLVKAGLRMLVEQLGENDKIAIAVYAGNAGLLLPSTHGHHKREILEAIDRLVPGGSTNGADGIALAYDQAVQNFIEGGVNRVILATDGDFNTGLTGADNVAALAAEKAKSGVFLTVLGVGQGNVQDELMEKVANQANGNYSYLDTLMEAHRVLVEQVGGTLVTIAKDVKIQVDFNPRKVREFRLIGYENRHLADRDFADDTKDAGEIGSGHAVTALYELVPAGEAGAAELLAERDGPQSRYAKPAVVAADAPEAEELLTVRLRWKAPDGQESQPVEHHVADEVKDLGHASADTKFAAAVAEFGMLLRGSRFAGQASLSAACELAAANVGDDPSGRRAELVGLIEKAQSLRPEGGGPADPPLTAPSPH
jgi:Ca-activated chloride channel family protein